VSAPNPCPTPVSPLPETESSSVKLRAAMRAENREWWRWHFAGQAQAALLACGAYQDHEPHMVAFMAKNNADALVREMERE
jgi:hypothetical protein